MSEQYVPVTPGGTPCVWIAAKTEAQAWANLLKDAAHMPYKTIENLKKARVHRGEMEMTNKTTTKPTESVDLDRLEQLARAATRGPWKRCERLNGPFWHISSEHTIGGEPCKSGRQAIAAVHGESKKGAAAYAAMFEANADFIAAANPATLLALIALARRAPAQQEADERVLPPLPHTTYNGYSDGSEPLYTVEQMQDYAHAARATQPVGQLAPGDLTNRLRKASNNPGRTHNDIVLLIEAADEIDRLAAAPVSAPGDERAAVLDDATCDEAAAKALEKIAQQKGMHPSEISTDTNGHRAWRRALVRAGFALAAPAAQAVEPAGQRAVGEELSERELRELRRILSHMGVGAVESLDSVTAMAAFWSLIGLISQELRSKPTAGQAAAGPVLIQALEVGNDRESSAWFDIHPSEVQSYTEEGYKVRRLYEHAAPTVAAAGPVASIGDDRKFMRLLLDCESARFGDIQPARDALIAHIEGYVRAKLSAAAGDAKDAARYRWLASRFRYDHITHGRNGYHYDAGPIPGDDMELDAAIDAAIAAMASPVGAGDQGGA